MAKAKEKEKVKEKGKEKTKERTKEKVVVKSLPTKKIRRRDQVKKGPHGGVQVVLIDDVVHVGKQGQIVEVKSGYGLDLASERKAR